MNKLIESAQAAVADIPDGSVIAVGGFGICGTPHDLIAAVLSAGVRDLHLVANNCGLDAAGLGLLLAADRVRKVTCSYVGSNQTFARKILQGEVELELLPQGTLAERLRAAGAGLAAFYTPTGAGTQVSKGGLPELYNASGEIVRTSAAKETRLFEGVEYVLETALKCDFALVRAHRADPAGNLVFRLSARNFNPVCSMAAAATIVEAETVVPLGDLDPDHVHVPGIFVQHVVRAHDEVPPIERVTVRPKEAHSLAAQP